MTRIHGLDLARALAIIGMMIAHMGPGYPATNGYPSVLFAVLAGVSMGIISRDISSNLINLRFRLILRGVILVGLGMALSLLQFGIAVILTSIGVCYVLLTPVITWKIRSLWILLAVLVVGGPTLVATNTVLLINWGDYAVVDLFLGVYPLLAWLAYLLAGLLIYRLVISPGKASRSGWLMLLGLVLLAGTQGILELSDFRVGLYDELNWIGAYLQGEPHSGGLLDVLGSAGAAMAIIGLCLLLCRLVAVVWVSYPLRAMGSMSLTVYIVHVIVTTIMNGTFLTAGGMYAGAQPFLPKEDLFQDGDFGWSMYPPSSLEDLGGAGFYEDFSYLDDPALNDLASADSTWLWMFAAQAVALLIFASLWKWRFRRGPLEWGVHRMIEGAVGSEAVAIGSSSLRSDKNAAEDGKRHLLDP